MKEAGMRIRVEPVLRDEFTEACKRQHLPAAQRVTQRIAFLQQC